MSPVNIAAEKGHLELLAWLLEGGAEVPANSLHLAIMKQKDCTPAIVELLLKHGAMVNETGKGVSALMMASCYGDNETVTFKFRAHWKLLLGCVHNDSDWMPEERREIRKRRRRIS